MTSRLLFEVHGLSTDGTCVITVQHWSPGTLLTFRNGVRAGTERGTRERITGRFAQAREALTPTELTDAQARDKLRGLAGVEPAGCPCGEQLPIGGHRCVGCGLSPGQHAAGALSGAYRRPPIMLRVSS